VASGKTCESSAQAIDEPHIVRMPCRLGAHLARIEIAEAMTVMTRRMPARRTGPAPWKPLTALSGPITLPIEFDATPGVPASTAGLGQV
jgi:hypothetical protein